MEINLVYDIVVVKFIFVVLIFVTIHNGVRCGLSLLLSLSLYLSLSLSLSLSFSLSTPMRNSEQFYS